MAHTVLSLATNQPLPDTRPGRERLTLLFNVVILGLTGALVVSLARIPGRHRRLAQRGIPSWSDLTRRSGLAAVTNFALPVAVLYRLLGVPAWRARILFQPDLGYWLDAVAVVLFLKGLLELAVLRRVFRRQVDREDIAVTQSRGTHFSQDTPARYWRYRCQRTRG